MMMRKAYYPLIFACAAFALAGCAGGRQAQALTVTSPSGDAWGADGEGRAEADVTFHVPARYFSKRSRLVISPYVVDRGMVREELEPLVLDAPVYAKKNRRLKALEGDYRDEWEGVARPVASTAQATDWTYRAVVDLPHGTDSVRVMAVVSEDGCGECSGVDTVDVATVTRGLLVLRWMEPKADVQAKVVHGQGEARLQFVINKYDIRLDMGRNREELYGMLRKLEPVLRDSLARVESFEIYGLASADGPLSFNTPLARNRARSARDWVVERLRVPYEVADRIRIGSRPEGWQPVLEAMERDGHPDAWEVRDILDRYAYEDDDVAERYIRRLPCWPDIRDRYLHKDRRVVYTYTYTIRNFTTDGELLDMYATRPDAFNEQELLRVAALMPTDGRKMEVYRATLARFPQCRTAVNNLAFLLVREGRVAEARECLGRMPELYPHAGSMRLTVEGAR